MNQISIVIIFNIYSIDSMEDKYYNVLIGLTQQGTKSCKSPKYRTAEVLQ